MARHQLYVVEFAATESNKSAALHVLKHVGGLDDVAAEFVLKRASYVAEDDEPRAKTIASALNDAGVPATCKLGGSY